MFVISENAKKKIFGYINDNNDLIPTIVWSSEDPDFESGRWELGFHTKDKKLKSFIQKIDNIDFVIDVDIDGISSLKNKKLDYINSTFVFVEELESG